jgi:hypothetical protein
MATQINKPISRETQSLVNHKGKDRPVIVTLNRSTIELRIKGIRTRGIIISYDRLFNEQEMVAARNAVGL